MPEITKCFVMHSIGKVGEPDGPFDLTREDINEPRAGLPEANLLR